MTERTDQRECACCGGYLGHITTTHTDDHPEEHYRCADCDASGTRVVRDTTTSEIGPAFTGRPGLEALAEKAHLRQVYQRHDGCIVDVADDIGVHESTARRRLVDAGIHEPNGSLADQLEAMDPSDLGLDSDHGGETA